MSPPPPSPGWSTLLTFVSNWKWPGVQGRENFQGTMIHTASWPKGFDATNKTIAVIGNGSTGVQVLPELQKGE